MEQIAMVGGIAALVLFSLGIICIAFAERGPVDTDLDASGKPLSDAQARPEEAERPAFLPPKPIQRKRAARTPDRVVLSIHKREQERENHGGV